MDSVKLILTEPVSPPAMLEQLDKSMLSSISEEKKKQAAKDFESVLLNKLLDEMKNSIVDWGSEKDGTSKQIQGIFWLYLARDIANNGGLGLWKDIYQSLTNAEHANTEQKSDFDGTSASSAEPLSRVVDGHL
jgi:Rod binding domain-containing protein